MANNAFMVTDIQTGGEIEFASITEAMECLTRYLEIDLFKDEPIGPSLDANDIYRGTRQAQALEIAYTVLWAMQDGKIRETEPGASQKPLEAS